MDKTWAQVESELLRLRCRPVRISLEYYTVSPWETYFSVLMVENRGVAETVGRSCRRSRTTSVHRITGTPARDEWVWLRLESGPANSPAMLLIAASRVTRSGEPMELHLDFLGAPGCYLYLDPAMPVTTNAQGATFLATKAVERDARGHDLHAVRLP